MKAAVSDVLIFDRQLMEEGDYWTKQLSHEPGESNLKLDYLRPASYVNDKGTVELRLTGPLFERLVKLTNGSSFLLYTSLLATLNICLYKYTGNPCIAVGSPPRKHGEDSPNQSNALAIVSRLDDDLTFRQLLTDLKETLLEAYARQRYPFKRLAKDLKLRIQDNRCPIFDVAMVFTDIHASMADLNNDITIIFERRSEEIAGTIEFNSSIFLMETIVRFKDHLVNLLAGAIDNTGTAISDLKMLTESEQRQIVEWNDTVIDYGHQPLIHQIFEAQVEQTPEALALVFESERLTFKELNCRANKLARYLQGLDVGPEVLAGVMMERSVEMVVALLAVLKAGGAYVPFDPAYPKQRVSFMMDDSRVPVLLVKQHLLNDANDVNSSGARVIAVDSEVEAISTESEENLPSLVKADNLAYVIFTSGSTGQPKGAMNTHGGILNRLLWMQRAYRLGESDCVLQKTPFSFDVSVWEFFWPLMAGARLVVARPGGHQDTTYLARLIHEHKVTTLHFVPSMLEAFLAEPEIRLCDSIRQVICSGEALAYQLQQRFYERFRAELHNLYGPTEAAVDVTFWHCLPEVHQETVPIGKPISNTQIYLLDKKLQLVPAGAAGELHIGGVGLARGYSHRPDLTAEKFIPDPISMKAGSRLYRTGDLARYLPDGNIEFLGRCDHQVKLRGFRIELGEIESVLRQNQEVREVAVLVREDVTGDQRLVAYIVPASETAPSINELRAFLLDRVPEYMVPALFITIDRMPLSPNGKLDRRALPAPEQSRPGVTTAYVGPRSPLEETLAGIWAQVLKIDQVGVNDNFFELGGHSLLATQVISRIRQVFNAELPLLALFELPTVAGLAVQVEQKLGKAERISQIAVIPRGDKDIEGLLAELEQLDEHEVQLLLANEMANE